MLFNGYKGLTLLDYPGKTAAMVYTGGCNFRCPFCHNAVLVFAPHTQPVISGSEVLEKLSKRKGMLEGLVITGGEPTLQAELPGFCAKVKELGFQVKLDTNGSNPEMVGKLIDMGVVDYIAMDVKSGFTPALYSAVTGIPEDRMAGMLEEIVQTRDIIISAGMGPQPKIGYEFRTTVVGGIHKPSDFESIAGSFRQLAAERPGCEVKAYFLQAYRASEGQISPKGLSVPSAEFMRQCRAILSAGIPAVRIRGEEEA